MLKGACPWAGRIDKPQPAVGCRLHPPSTVGETGRPSLVRSHQGGCWGAGAQLTVPRALQSGLSSQSSPRAGTPASQLRPWSPCLHLSIDGQPGRSQSQVLLTHVSCGTEILWVRVRFKHFSQSMSSDKEGGLPSVPWLECTLHKYC